MKLINYFQLLIAITLSALFLSCDNDDNTPEKITEIKSIAGTIKADLTLCEGWKLYVGGEEYDYTLDGNKFTAVPVSEPYKYDREHLYIDIQFRSGEPYPLGRASQITYADQSTWKEFIWRDQLQTIIQLNNPVKQLNNVVLTHKDVLVDFSVTGVPENGLVYIGQRGEVVMGGTGTVKPLADKNKPDTYKAIMPNKAYELTVFVTVGEEVYSKAIEVELDKTRSEMIIHPNLPGGTVVSFQATMNNENEISIENLKVKPDVEWNLKDLK